MPEMHQHAQRTTLLDCGGMIPPSIIFFRDFCSENIFYSFLLCIDHRRVSFHPYVPECCFLFFTIFTLYLFPLSTISHYITSVLGLLRINVKIESEMRRNLFCMYMGICIYIYKNIYKIYIFFNIPPRSFRSKDELI